MHVEIGDVNIMSESEKEDIRNDLEKYLLDFREKKNEDGKPLVQFPNNFDSVVNAMNRKDVLSSNNRPWTKLLLSEKFDQDIGEYFEGGRYRHILDESQSLQNVEKGLAEIEMLDKQLALIRKKERQLHNLDDPLGIFKPKMDFTFITREDTEISSRGNATARSMDDNASDEGERIESSRPGQVDHPGTSEEARNTPDACSAPYDADDSRRELRLRELLNDADEEGPAWVAMARYGYTDEHKKRLEEIDHALEKIGRGAARPPPPSSSSAAQGDVSGGSAPAADKVSYLQQQRVDRVAGTYNKLLDNMLRSIREEESDLSLLVDPVVPPPPMEAMSGSSSAGSSVSFLPPLAPAPESSTRKFKERIKKQHTDPEEGNSSGIAPNQSYATLPDVTTVDMRRKVTSKEIGALINEMCYSSNSPSDETVNEPVEDSKKVKLLASIQYDVKKLMELRACSRYSAVDNDVAPKLTSTRYDQQSQSPRLAAIGVQGGGSRPGLNKYDQRLKSYYDMVSSFESSDTADTADSVASRTDSVHVSAEAGKGWGGGRGTDTNASDRNAQGTHLPRLTRLSALELKESLRSGPSSRQPVPVPDTSGFSEYDSTRLSVEGASPSRPPHVGVSVESASVDEILLKYNCNFRKTYSSDIDVTSKQKVEDLQSKMEVLLSRAANHHNSFETSMKDDSALDDNDETF